MTFTHKRTQEMLDLVINQMVERTGMKPREVVADLLEIGFTPAELISLKFDKEDVSDLAAEMGIELELIPEEKTWMIPVTWEECGVVAVKAHTLHEAVEKVNNDNDDISLPAGNYVDGSFACSYPDSQNEIEEMRACYNHNQKDNVVPDVPQSDKCVTVSVRIHEGTMETRYGTSLAQVEDDPVTPKYSENEVIQMLKNQLGFVDDPDGKSGYPGHWNDDETVGAYFEYHGHYDTTISGRNVETAPFTDDDYEKAKVVLHNIIQNIQASGDTREQVNQLLALGFDTESLIENLGYTESDIADALDSSVYEEED